MSRDAGADAEAGGSVPVHGRVLRATGRAGVDLRPAARCWPAMTTTCPRVSRCVTTTIRTRAPRWSMRWPGTAPRCWRCWTAGSGTRRWTGPGRCWPPCWVRTWTRDEAGVFRIARRVARDRVISTVDPETRHGHKTAARGFDGYKGHI